MAQSNNDIFCVIDNNKSSYNYHFTISIPAKVTESFFQLATQTHQQLSHTTGFSKGTIPLTYVQKHFKTPIINHLKEVGLKFFGINSLLQNIRKQKIVLVGPPKLKDIEFDGQGNTLYHFAGSYPKELYMQSWKYLPFKPSPRKKYRDIDKQVKNFLEEEESFQSKFQNNATIHVGDWVYFHAWIVNPKGKGKRIFNQHYSQAWIKVGDEEPDLSVQKLFVGKQIGDHFITDNACFQNYFCEVSNNNYVYEIAIQDIVPNSFFNLDLFKQFFKIKTHKDLHNKLIEVFSFHHDISQRRLTAFEALELIMKKNHIILPDDAINRQKKEIINEMQFKPDFMVYKMNENFDTNVTELAKKQLVDEVIAEFIGYQDNLAVSHQDIKALLHLTQRPRIKDFVYFPFIKSQHNGQETPVDNETLYQFCLKEKAVNHIIHHLTKK